MLCFIVIFLLSTRCPVLMLELDYYEFMRRRAPFRKNTPYQGFFHTQVLNSKSLIKGGERCPVHYIV